VLTKRFLHISRSNMFQALPGGLRNQPSTAKMTKYNFRYYNAFAACHDWPERSGSIFGPNGGHLHQRVLRSEQPFVIEMLDTVLQQTTP
jgi:hypothetical protein